MKQRIVVIGALLLGFLAVGPARADAAFKTFLFVPGIAGSATEIHHVDWIEVLSMSQGVASTKKAVSCSDVSVMKSLDEAGPALWVAAAMGQVFPELRLHVVNSEGAIVYDLKFTNGRVTSTQTSGSSELPTESVSFSYQTLTLTFNPQDSTGHVIPGIPQTISCQ